MDLPHRSESHMLLHMAEEGWGKDIEKISEDPRKGTAGMAHLILLRKNGGNAIDCILLYIIFSEEIYDRIAASQASNFTRILQKK